MPEFWWLQEFLKGTILSCAKPLVILFTHIFQTGMVPSKFKDAVSVPLFKEKGSKHDPSNFRLISNLSSYNKIFERIVKCRLTKFLNDNQIFADNQHGFRNKRSCQTALTVFSQFVHDKLDEKKKVLALFVDLKKAFDFVKQTFN